jgi:pimeloyl-ACP methyl ester carboxylesterase
LIGQILRPAVDSAVLLPGTGSDEVFVRSVFEGPLTEAGMRLVAPAPVPGPDVVEHHFASLDAAWTGEPIVVGGVSLGAHVAAAWAMRNPSRCAGLLLALPAWNGPAVGAPAAWSAAASAAAVSEKGLHGALDGVAGWLRAELLRAWGGHGDGLADTLLAASRSGAPTLEELAAIDVPVGVAAFVDDPVHPVEVARVWAKALPRAALRTTSLEAVGADREALGRAALCAWRDACGD